MIEAGVRMRTDGAPSENIYTHRKRDLADVSTFSLIARPKDLTDAIFRFFIALKANKSV